MTKIFISQLKKKISFSKHQDESMNTQASRITNKHSSLGYEAGRKK